VQLYKQSTAASLIVGPILDSTGVEYTGAVIGDISLSKNGGTLTALASAATLTHIANGQYTLALTTGNTDTLGRGELFCNKSTYQMPPVRIQILASGAFDILVTNGTLASTTNITAGTITTVTTVTNQLTAAQVATGVWQDAAAGDFTTSGSIGKSLYTSGVVPGGSGGLLISGSNSGTTTLGALTVSGAVAFQSTFAVTTSTSLAALSCTTLTASAAVAFQSTFTTTGNLTAANLTNTRIGYLDNLSAGAVAQAATALSTTQWTSARAGYLDNINNSTLAAASFPTDPADESLIIAATDAIMSRIGAAGANLTALGDTRLANLDAAVSSRMATYTQPTGFLAATFPTTVASTTNITAASGVALTSAYDFAKGTVAVTESYNADGSAPTPVQALMVITQMLTEMQISGTTMTVKKLDGSTTALVLTLDASTPTSVTRSA
jgi:hypothetical protein